MGQIHTPPGAPVALEPSYTHDQLHERACIVCGATQGPLLSCGHVTTHTIDGDPLIWPVVACSADWGRPLC